MGHLGQIIIIIFCFISFQLFRVPFSAIHFCNLVACSVMFLFGQVHILVPCFQISFVKYFFSILFFIYFFYNIFNLSFKVRDLFSFIWFLKYFPRIFSSLSVSNQPWFSLPMHWFNEDSLLQTENFFRWCSKKLNFQRLLFVQCQLCTFLSTAASSQVCHYRRKRQNEKISHTTSISVTFIYFIHFYTHFRNLSKTCP